ncbi:MAG: DUF1467 family protein [Candidatus Nucleicultricaceae bacterium]
MDVVSQIVLYLMIWWLVLFTVLPFGIERDDAFVLGTDRGAPKNPRLWVKLAITTGISFLLWFLASFALKHLLSI